MPPMDVDEGSSGAPAGIGRESVAARKNCSMSSAEGAAQLRALASLDEAKATEALKWWQDQLQRKLVYAVLKWTSSMADSEEIASDAFQRLWKHRRRFADAAERGYASPWRWLWATSKKLAMDVYRRRNAEKRGKNPEQVALEDAGITSPHPEASYIQAIALERFRDSLRPIERILWDRYLAGYSVREISAALRNTETPLTQKQVRSRLETMRDRFASLFALGS